MVSDRDILIASIY